MRMYPESYEGINETEPVRTRTVKSIILSVLLSVESTVIFILSVGALLGILAAAVCLIMLAYQKGGTILAVGIALLFVAFIFNTDNL